MRYGSVRHSISLPLDSFAGYSPDGLSEADIDDLLSESGLDADMVDVDETAEHEAAPVFPLPDGAWTPTTKPSRGEVA